MFIQTESTPNPATLKFLPGQEVMPKGTANYTSAEEAANSPLAQRLFGIEGVGGVYLGSDFITCTKGDDKDWDVMKPLILGAIMEHLTAGQPVITETAGGAHGAAEAGSIEAQIQELLDTRVRPAVAQDGGDIVFDRFEEGIVYLHMQGSCAGCPSSTATLKHGVENMLKYYIPEIQEVQQI
ncbi:MAG: NifU family protein [Magnetovibrionaceae bacterium]